jgi:hypothetical protein
MWIEITKSYYGPLGSFSKGTKKDMTDNKETAKTLINENYASECSAPWDDMIDVNLQKVNELRQECTNLQLKRIAAQTALSNAKKAANKIPSLTKTITSIKEKLAGTLKMIENLASSSKDNSNENTGSNANQPGPGPAGSGQGQNDGNAAGQAAQTRQGQ